MRGDLTGAGALVHKVSDQHEHIPPLLKPARLECARDSESEGFREAANQRFRESERQRFRESENRIVGESESQ